MDECWTKDIRFATRAGWIRGIWGDSVTQRDLEDDGDCKAKRSNNDSKVYKSFGAVLLHRYLAVTLYLCIYECTFDFEIDSSLSDVRCQTDTRFISNLIISAKQNRYYIDYVSAVYRSPQLPQLSFCRPIQYSVTNEP